MEVYQLGDSIGYNKKVCSIHGVKYNTVEDTSELAGLNDILFLNKGVIIKDIPKIEDRSKMSFVRHKNNKTVPSYEMVYIPKVDAFKIESEYKLFKTGFSLMGREVIYG
jgi:hypothetical protein